MSNIITTKPKRRISKPPENTMEDIKSAYRMLAKVSHSDVNGGTDETMANINVAMDSFKKLCNSNLHIGIVLDDSGSMRGKRQQAIKAYNSFLANQSTRGNVTVSLATFHSMDLPINLALVPKLTRETYHPTGGTPLYDTIAGLIHSIDRELNKPHDVIVCIITDGQECSSKEYRNPDLLKELIQAKIAVGWQFIYCSCSWYALEHGQRIGIPKNAITSFQDIEKLMGCVGKLISQFRTGAIKQITFEGSIV